LQTFGCEVTARVGIATVRPPARLEGARISVPGDFSSAAFFIVAACIGAREPFTIAASGSIHPHRVARNGWR